MKDNLSLERMWPLLELAGNPHEKLKVIHVAGTSGKTSTCYYISSLLHASGLKVGMSVSPHIYSINERVQIDTKPISDSVFCDYLQEFDELVGELVSKQSYFEFMIVFALWVFVQEKVDYVVLETGLGGLLDSTNVVTRADKVCVITDIGFDHQHILGSTIEEIASQKAGIIHENNHVVGYTQNELIMNVLKTQMRLKNATFQSVSEKNGVKYEGLASFQKRNYTLARAAAEYLAQRDNFSLSKVDPRSVAIPGRMQTIHQDGKKIIVDGAHNPQKMRAFVSSIKDLYPDQKFDIVLAMKISKDCKATVRELVSISDRLLCIQPGDDFIPTYDLVRTCREAELTTKGFATIKDALRSAKKGQITLLTGSLMILNTLEV